MGRRLRIKKIDLKINLHRSFQLPGIRVNWRIICEAWERRINQLNGSNENSENQLLEAYRAVDKSNQLIIRDGENLHSLARPFAVFNYLKKLQREGKSNVINKDPKN